MPSPFFKKFSNSNFLALSVAVAASLCATALGQGNQAAKVTKEFMKLDADGSGLLTPEEAKPYGEMLKGADLNGDGISLLEVLAHLRSAAKNPAAAISPAPEKPYEALEQATTLNEAPVWIKPADAGIGRRLTDESVADAAGKKLSLSALAGKSGMLVLLVDHSCPVAKKNFPKLCRLEETASKQGISVVPVSLQPLEKIGKDQAAGFRSAMFTDPAQALQKRLEAKTSTEIYLYDAALTLRYRGAVDDQYGVGYSQNAPQNSYLADAMAAMLAGAEIRPQATTAPGCELALGKATVADPSVAANTPVTFHNQISRILQTNCQECHHDGGLAPFPLITHEQVVAKAGMVRRMVSEDQMPPWFAAHLPQQVTTPWRNERALSPADKQTLLGWLAGDKPAGNKAEAPVPRSWPKDWQTGVPDAIFQIPNPIAVKAEGTMRYQNITVPTNFTEDRWVQAWEVLPTAREVVHHVLVFALDPTKSKKAQITEAGGGFLAAYVPGNNSERYPAGYAKRVPAGALLHFQIHYTPNGKATQDQVQLGLKFAKAPPKHEVRVVGIADGKLSIPPNTSKHPETASIPVPSKVRLLSLSPHMHLRGKAFRFDAHLPDGSKRTLLDVPRYDFNWQLAYRYREFPAIPAGSRLQVTGWFDNSSGNPANPDPSQLVRWGEQTEDEMLIGYVEFVEEL